MYELPFCNDMLNMHFDSHDSLKPHLLYPNEHFFIRGRMSFDEFRTNLIMYELRVLHLRARDQGITHQAFATTYGAVPTSGVGIHGTPQTGQSQGGGKAQQAQQP